MFDFIGLGFVGLLSLYILLRPILGKKSDKNGLSCGPSGCDTCGACARLQKAFEIAPSDGSKSKTSR